MIPHPETRVLRERLAALQSASGRAERRPTTGAKRQVVQVFQESSLPTAPDKFYAAHPCEASGPESEGATPAFDCDEGTTLYVDFLRKAPQAGNLAVATLVGGRWVAERGGTSDCACFRPCGSVPIPQGDLALTVDPPYPMNTGPPVSAATLRWNGSTVFAGWSVCFCFTTGSQEDPCPTGVPDSFNLYYSFGCGGFPVTFTWGLSDTCGPDAATPAIGVLTTPYSFQASPLQVVYKQLVGAGTPQEQIYTFTITGDAGLLPPATAPCANVCVTACGGLPLVGATVKALRADGSTAATGTTDGGGCCTLPVCGTFQTAVAYGGRTVYSARLNLWDSVAIAVTDATDLVCCGGCAIPATLTATDAAGSFSLAYCDSCAGGPAWTGGHAATQPSCTVDATSGCVVNAPTSGPVRVCYELTCNDGDSPAFAVRRSWSSVPFGGAATWYQDPTGTTPGQPCATDPPAACGAAPADVATGEAGATGSSPFVISFSMTPAGTNATADPVGGGVTISG